MPNEVASACSLSVSRQAPWIRRADAVSARVAPSQSRSVRMLRPLWPRTERVTSPRVILPGNFEGLASSAGSLLLAKKAEHQGTPRSPVRFPLFRDARQIMNHISARFSLIPAGALCLLTAAWADEAPGRKEPLLQSAPVSLQQKAVTPP